MQSGIFLDTLNTELRTVQNAVIQLGDIDDTGKGRRFVARFIQPGLVKIEGHGIVLLQKQTLDASLPTIVGSPVIIQHKDITEKNADELRCGVIANAQYNELDGWYYVDGIIWDEKAIELINKGWSVSCSYDFLAYNDEGGVENNIKYDKEFTQLNFTHLAIVDNPRYERANIVFNCKVDNGNQNKYPAGTEGGKGGQFAPSDGRSFKNYTYNILKRAQLMAGVENFETSKSGYAVRFTIPESNFAARQKALAQVLNKDKKVDFYSFGENASEGRQPIIIQFKKNDKKESEQDNMILNALKQLISVVENAKDGDENGRWITIKGTHVFIPDGKSVDEVMKEKGMSTSSTGKKGYSGDDEGVTGLITKEKDKQELDKITEMRKHLDEQSAKQKKELEGKYAREDADFDIEQLEKDIREAQSFGYEEVEDIAEFLGLDEDEVRETIGEGDRSGSSFNDEGFKKFTEANKRKGAGQKSDAKDRQNLDNELVIVQKADTRKLEARLNDLKSRYNEVMKYYWEADEDDRDIHQYKADAIQDEMIRIQDRLDELKKNKENKTNNSKEQDMLLDEIKKLIKRVENNKETEEMVENEKVDKRKLIDEVGGILKGKVDEEVWRTIIGKLEKMSYNESEAGTADNKKVKNEDEDEKEDKKVENEDAEDEKKVDELKKEEKEDVDNKCKNSKSSFDKINEIYNSVRQIEKETGFVSRQQKLDNAVEYFK